MSYPEFIAWLKQEWPNPPDHVLARLRHTLDTYDSPHLNASRPEDEFVLTATRGVYIDHRGEMVPTGLTWGDLRLIRDVLVRLWALENDRPMAQLLNIPPNNFGPTSRPRIR